MSATPATPALGAGLRAPARKSLLDRIELNAGTALLDQALVSGCRFLTTIVIGRACGAEELGAFALSFQVLVLVAVAQETLISAPYTIFCNRYTGRARGDYAGSAMLHAAVLAGLVFIGLLAAGLLLPAAASGSELARLVPVLAVVAPCVLLREFGRRFLFAHLRMRAALAMDAAMAAIQIAGLIGLALADRLSASAALWVMGLAAAVSGAGWLLLDRRRFRFRLENVRPAWRRNWASGRWLFGSRIVAVGTDASLYALLALVSGLEAAGVFAACMAVVLIANPILLGLCNWLEPLTARAFAERGRAGVRRVVRHGQLLLLGVLSAFCLIVALFGADLVALLYGRAEYANQGHLVAVLAVFIVVSALGAAPSFGLRAIEKSDRIFWSDVLEAAVVFGVVIALAGQYGLLAAAYALLLGAAASTTMRSLAFLRGVGAAPDTSLQSEKERQQS